MHGSTDLFIAAVSKPEAESAARTSAGSAKSARRYRQFIGFRRLCSDSSLTEVASAVLPPVAGHRITTCGGTAKTRAHRKGTRTAWSGWHAENLTWRMTGRPTPNGKPAQTEV